MNANIDGIIVFGYVLWLRKISHTEGVLQQLVSVQQLNQAVGHFAC